MLAVLAIVAVVAVVGQRARRGATSPLLGRLRALFPAWRLFDRATVSPALLVRFAIGAGALGAWSSIHDARRTRPLRWLFAPHDNLALAYQSVVDQLVGELGELADLEGSPDRSDDGDAGETDPAVVGLVSYELVTRIARVHVPAGARFQWKVVIAGAAAASDEDYVRSQVFAA